MTDYLSHTQIRLNHATKPVLSDSVCYSRDQRARIVPLADLREACHHHTIEARTLLLTARRQLPPGVSWQRFCEEWVCVSVRTAQRILADD